MTRTPCGDHVEVEHSSTSAVEHATLLEGLDPEVESEHEEENGDSFVVVGSSNRARDVSGNNADETCGEETCRLVFQLTREPA